MKILFLDIDGVLNSMEYMAKNPIDPNKSAFDRDVSQIDPVAVALLNEIIEQTEAKVVISSTWRLLMCISNLRGILNAAGFKGEIIGVTPRIRGPRGNEIQEWLTFTNFNYHDSTFVILDDDGDMGELIHYLVQTTSTFGLQREHVERAVGFLNYQL